MILFLLLGVTLASVFSYISELKARFSLQDSLAQTQIKLTLLTQEQQNLLQELKKEKEFSLSLLKKNYDLKVYLKASQIRLGNLLRENAETQQDLAEINTRFAVLKAENRALIESHKRGYIENQQLKLKLSSVRELKKAIRALRTRRAPVYNLDTEKNQGFMTKDGWPTLDRIKIEVLPAKN